MPSCGANAENMAMEEERNFERKIMNCTLVLLHTQDQIKELDVAVPHMEAEEALQETGDAQERAGRETALLRDGTGPTPSRTSGV